MSEMLGNQYFMARNYSAAQKEFEEVLLKYPDNRPAKKKLVVCYTQTRRLKESFAYFLDIIKTDIEFIVKTDTIRDDCPCAELIEKLEPRSTNYLDTFDYNLTLGIIWLYCDILQSKHYFTKLKKMEPSNLDIEAVCVEIDNYLLKVV
ncbi:MAG: hypothetical protein FD143_1641 [Ignavibacteria bacterium]|nr:MAG: hypothetical protein FD143_1641 [Ignavibacteria bacterium]KAF0161795.1 MAG: hypothetical protein FD188_600 [Ignavibacteria bacterium]